MKLWTVEKGMRVTVDRMGIGTVTKVTGTGVMVHLDQYGIEVEVQKEWMQPVEDTGTQGPTIHETPVGTGARRAETDELGANGAAETPSEGKINTAEMPSAPASAPEAGEEKNYSPAARMIMGAMGIPANSQQRNGTSSRPEVPPTILKDDNNTSEPPPTNPVDDNSTGKPPESNKGQAAGAESPPSKGAPEPEQLQARRALESLRFGLVPHGHIESLTLGYNELRNWVLGCLPEHRDNAPGLYKVVGPFGTGKSHTMEVIRHLAEKEGYLTAKAEVDGQTVSLSEPAKLLHTLCSSLAGENFHSEAPLVSLYEKLLEKGETDAIFRKFGMSKSFGNMNTIERMRNAEILEQYDTILESILTGSDEYSVSEVEGRIQRERAHLRWGINLWAPISRTVSKRAIEFIEALVSISLLAHKAGYKGLVVMIDEFEVETTATRLKFERVAEQVRLLCDYVSGKISNSLPAAPLALFIGTVGQFNNKAEAWIDYHVRNMEGAVYKLRTWDQEERLELSGKIYELYQHAYGLRDPYDRGLAVGLEGYLTKNGEDSGLIRRFIKWYVAFLDMKYGPPGRTV